METREEKRESGDYYKRKEALKGWDIDEQLYKLSFRERLDLLKEITDAVYEEGTFELIADINKIKLEFVLDNFVDLR